MMCRAEPRPNHRPQHRIVIGQGAKPGGGGMLLGQKVNPRVARMRTLPEGVDQRSASRHPDWTGPDDLVHRLGETHLCQGRRDARVQRCEARRARRPRWRGFRALGLNQDLDTRIDGSSLDVADRLGVRGKQLSDIDAVGYGFGRLPATGEYDLRPMRLDLGW
jgi:hypothetical protein